MVSVQSIAPADVQACVQCRKGQTLDVDLRFAYQPIVDIAARLMQGYWFGRPALEAPAEIDARVWG